MVPYNFMGLKWVTSFRQEEFSIGCGYDYREVGYNGMEWDDFHGMLRPFQSLSENQC